MPKDRVPPSAPPGPGCAAELRAPGRPWPAPTPGSPGRPSKRTSSAAPAPVSIRERDMPRTLPADPRSLQPKEAAARRYVVERVVLRRLTTKPDHNRIRPDPIPAGAPMAAALGERPHPTAWACCKQGVRGSSPLSSTRQTYRLRSWNAAIDRHPTAIGPGRSALIRHNQKQLRRRGPMTPPGSWPAAM